MSVTQASAAESSVLPAVRWRQLADSAVWTALVLLVLLALLMACRRLAGEMTQPLPGPVLVSVAAIVAAASVLLRLWLLPLGTPLRLRNWLVVAVPSLALLLLLSAVLTPGTSPPAAVAALLFAAAIEGLFWRHMAVAQRLPSAAAERLPRPAPLPAGADQAAQGSDEEAYPADLLQQIVRTRGAEGGEMLHAVLRADIPAGEQLHVLHVALCPPLASPPRLEAFITGDTAADVKVTAAYTFGARLEVHLSRPAAEPLHVLVEITGSGE